MRKYSICPNRSIVSTPPKSVALQEIVEPDAAQRNLRIWMARLDLVHPVVSGNKWYKLSPWLPPTAPSLPAHIVTCGGAYSNHLVATACLCHNHGIPSTGLVRGEPHLPLNSTLSACVAYGMRLVYVDRTTYPELDARKAARLAGEEFSNITFIPEGGYHPLGAKGIHDIADAWLRLNPHVVCTAVGTATTLAGLLTSAPDGTACIGVPALKGLDDIPSRIRHLTGRNFDNPHQVWNQYHFGGYARHTPALIAFMNSFFEKHGIPLDFVYTAKLMYAVMEGVRNNAFPPGSRLVCLHTGGLQGNRSLPAGTLLF